MAGKVFEVVSESRWLDDIKRIAEEAGVTDYHVAAPLDDGRQRVRLLVRDVDRQKLTDRLQGLLTGTEGWRLAILPVEVLLPLPADEEPDEAAAEADKEKDKNDNRKLPIKATREELFETVSRGAEIDWDFLLLAFLSTVVAAIGLVQDNVAVVIGAMVIAPLLGPNLALSFATAVGDGDLMARAIRANGVGVSVALLFSIAIGYFIPLDLNSAELMARTSVGLDGVALALASGAAAALSLTTGLSSTLVGVMVAVALLPPTATLGMMLGAQHLAEALGAAMLLVVNIVCVNLSAQLVFLAKGIKPRTWFEKKRAGRSARINAAVWVILLVILVGLILTQSR